MDAYGWDIISEEEKDILLVALKAGATAAEEDTVWSVAARILRRDIRQYRAEIYEIEGELNNDRN